MTPVMIILDVSGLPAMSVDKQLACACGARQEMRAILIAAAHIGFA